MPPAITTRAEFDKFVRDEIALWANGITDAGMPQQ